MRPVPPHAPAADAVAQHAADWLARRDRGLSAAEQDEYLQWLQRDPRHAAALAHHEATLRRMMRLGEWQPAQSAEPNPDLFAPPRRPRVRVRWLFSGFAAAAAAAVVFFLAGTGWRPAALTPPTAAVAKTYLRVNERLALPDGSLVELKDGSHLAVEFSAAERRVRLIGEAHFTVAKNPARPFIVEAAGVTVRAVGTAFNVRSDTAAVEVVVTEGTVRVDPPAMAAGEPASAPLVAPLVTAGQRAVVALAESAAPQVNVATPGEMAETLAWQTPRLQFFETPLAEAVAEFNRHNRQQLVLARPDLGTVPIGGTFRVNNPDGFVRLLQATLGVQVVSRSAEKIVLARGR